MRKLLILLTLLVSSAYASDATERKFIRNGMSEGQVLIKIGNPDRETVDSGIAFTQRRWTYLPRSGDEQTLTTITFQDGKVIEISRVISR